MTVRQSLINLAMDHGNIQWLPDYTEPGYGPADDTGVFLSNWNEPRAARIGELLEKDGASTEWEDEWASCNGCDRAVRTSPDSYSWTPNFVLLDECEIYCADCILEDLEAHETALTNDSGRADTLGIDWSERGWIQSTETYETGFHPGQTDDPGTVLATLHAVADPPDVLFQVTNKGQFDIRWTAWTRPGDYVAD